MSKCLGERDNRRSENAIAKGSKEYRKHRPPRLDSNGAHPPRPGKVKFAMRIDPDLLAWFRGQGRGYQTRINTILRAYYDQMRDRNAP
jgi:uncharacterized protein (DUF4415 family)